MRIAILTQPLRYNYGGILQNYALQIVLKRMGHKVVTLDPQRYNFHWWQYLYKALHLIFDRYILRKQEWSLSEKWEDDKIIRLLGKNTFQFIDNHIKRREYNNLKSEIKPSNFDAFIVGSDQVWRSEYNMNIKNMFLDFTKGWNVKRIAYAASFGLDTWKESEETTKCCKELLQQFDFVSVREDSGINICKDIFHIDALHVLDPTLLLTKEDYVSLLKIYNYPKSKGNLLVYILDYNEDINKLIQHIASEHNLTPFRVNSDVEDYDKDISKRIQPPVEQWIRGFYDADFVITDSFHACVFSIIFGKPFVVYTNEFRGSTRYKSLWNLLSLSGGIITQNNNYTKACTLSYDSKLKLDALRKNAICLLDNILHE